MMKPTILNNLCRSRDEGRKMLAVLIDPDKQEDIPDINVFVGQCAALGVDLFFVGGSLVTTTGQGPLIRQLKDLSDIPVVLFPGNYLHLDNGADGILLLSLISGRNPDYLIGQHVLAAPFLKNSGLEVIPTGYMLVGDDRTTTVAYISNSLPIPPGKVQIAVCTAMAGEMLGLRVIYMDAGSGAREPVPPEMIREIRKSTVTPLIVGGGLNNTEKMENALKAGADVIVLGNSLEKDQKLLAEAVALVKQYG